MAKSWSFVNVQLEWYKIKKYKNRSANSEPRGSRSETMTRASDAAFHPSFCNRRTIVGDAMALLVITAMLISLAMPAPSAAAPTLTTLYSFCSKAGCADSDSPDSLIQATDGNLYGTSFFGGPGGCCGLGLFFKMSLGGKFSALYDFCSGDCSEGLFGTGVMQAPDGNFYAQTSQGGARGSNGGIAKISPGVSETTFVSMTAKFRKPSGLLFNAADGLFYGIAEAGGTKFDGAMFTVTSTGAVKLRYSFCSAANCTDGSGPSTLTQADDGNFYGTTFEGGSDLSNCGGLGCGTIFKLTPGGELTTFYNFCPTSVCPGVSFPGPIIQGTDGDFYGLTSSGGPDNPNCYQGCGTVFKVTPSGTFSRLYSFCSQSNCADGISPGSLILGSDGNLYGTTGSGGVINSKCEPGGCGTIFRISPSGAFATIYSFCSKAKCADGDGPGVLMQDTNGDFYGTTDLGGANNHGTFFRLSVGLGGFVQTQVAFAKVGASVVILGTDLAGATSVTINGTRALFAVKSASEITATIAPGTTTGFIKVVTPGGTLTSNAKLGVSP
jgi:uncharacterized repeat protein (TIGR03803 family)